MVAANLFRKRVIEWVKSRSSEASSPASSLPGELSVQVELFGSLALTGHGHATDSAILAGLSGLLPDTCTPEEVQSIVASIRQSNRLQLERDLTIDFTEATDLIWQRSHSLPEHPNGMRFRLLGSSIEGNCQSHNGLPQASQYSTDGVLQCCLEEEYFSTGGGFVYSKAEIEKIQNSARQAVPSSGDKDMLAEDSYPFKSAAELLSLCKKDGITIAELMESIETRRMTKQELEVRFNRIWQVMSECIDRGCLTEGELPGSLHLKRRAAGIFKELRMKLATEISKPSDLESISLGRDIDPDHLVTMDWISMFALAVNEENAAGGKVVTAPTNGASGVIPAVLAYYLYAWPGTQRKDIYTFFMTAGAIGLLYKRNASLSAAEMGCQGEVGVACSMAAAGLAAVMGGTIEQIENAAEIGMEHNLGLTCDPIAGLVQIPCIERNTMGAIKAINAARLAVLYGSGHHYVSLDRVIETMRQTGLDMQNKYKETSLGGLAVNVVDC